MRPHLATLVDDFRRHGSDIAIVSHRGNRRIASTYSELAALVDRFAASLIQRNIPAGERVVIWGQNGVEWIAAFFGCVVHGVICVPLDAAGSPEFAHRILQETTPRLVVGDSDLLDQLDSSLTRLHFEDFASTLPPATAPAPVDPALSLDSPLQILFTSGTTAEPKGVVHTHRNILASVAPIENEIPKYLKYERWVHPLRFLHTLPLSHVFGQFMGLWVPPLLGAEVHFESRLQAQRLIELSKRERISVLASVPRVLALLRDQLIADHPDLPAAIQAAQGQRVWKRWWRFRKIHHTFGYKFWAFVCGGASLPEDVESFWTTLGFALIQGYGMTETAALITLNHPFKTSRGTIGKVLPGRTVEIRPDGELVVRGDMVSTNTWRGGAIQQSESPWLETGDLASKDEEGRLRFLGRKSQVIVTSSGLNVHPEDVEAALNREEGVQSSAVVPLLTPSGTDPVAVLLFRGSRDEAETAVIAANTRLADFQRVRQWRIWPKLDFPRTSTGKVQRHKITEWVNTRQPQARKGDIGSDPLRALILSITHAQPEKTGDNARLQEDLQLDSLGRVQLQAELEQKLGLTLSDEMLEQVATLGELRHTLGLDVAHPASQETSSASFATHIEPRHDIYPHWPWTWPIRILRVLFMECIHQPLVRLLAAPSVRRESPLNPQTPLLIIGNHVTEYDVPLILYALPGHMRRHVATAMAADILDDWRKRRNQGSWLINTLGPLTSLLVTALFNVFPLPRSAGFRRSFQHAGEALDHGYNVIVFPEGHRSGDGTLQPFRSGIGILVNESQVPVLPVALKGLEEMQAGRQRWFRSGKLQVIVGTPITFPPNTDPEAIATRLHTELARLLNEK
ncbi:MAG TPA: AMP-binding protein [Acidobacteriaceae bacterium]|nr:AMP-binding protein [Acidobacteriaceae bacterium]